jgi:hypothetical protein
MKQSPWSSTYQRGGKWRSGKTSDQARKRASPRRSQFGFRMRDDGQNEWAGGATPDRRLKATIVRRLGFAHACNTGSKGQSLAVAARLLRASLGPKRTNGFGVRYGPFGVRLLTSPELFVRVQRVHSPMASDANPIVVTPQIGRGLYIRQSSGIRLPCQCVAVLCEMTAYSRVGRYGRAEQS